MAHHDMAAEQIRLKRAWHPMFAANAVFFLTLMFGLLPLPLLAVAIGMSIACFSFLALSRRTGRKYALGIYLILPAYVLFVGRYINTMFDAVYLIQVACIHASGARSKTAPPDRESLCG